MQGKQDHLQVTCSIPCLLLQRGQVLCRRAGSLGTCAWNKDTSRSLQGKRTSISLAQLLQRTRLPWKSQLLVQVGSASLPVRAVLAHSGTLATSLHPVTTSAKVLTQQEGIHTV